MMSLDSPDTPRPDNTAELFAVMQGRICPTPAGMVEVALRASRQVNAMRRVARHWPCTRTISLLVARYITTLIPEANGQPVFFRALASAIQHTLACILAHPGRALDAESLRTFVARLFQPLPVVLQCRVEIPAHQRTWNPLAGDLYDWLPARDRVVIYRCHTPLEQEQLPSFYATLLPRLLTPDDLWAMHLTLPELLALLLKAPDAPGPVRSPDEPCVSPSAHGSLS